jgi:Zn-dependent M16 (insulinase) family peptidase
MNEVIDNGNDSIDVTGEALDNRSQMLASAALIVSQTVAAEAKIGETAKTWGHSLFSAVYRDNANLDALIGDSKVAAGWNNLSASEGGRKAKQRMEVYFSNARLVAERWNMLTDEQREAVLNGLSSIHYLAGQFRKADADAKKAAKKAEEAKVAAQQAAEGGSVSTDETGEADTLETAVMRLIDRYQAATVEERDAAYDALALLFETVNGDAEVIATPEGEGAQEIAA